MPWLVARKESFACSALLLDKDGTLVRFHDPWLTWGQEVVDHALRMAGLPATTSARLLSALGVRKVRAEYRPDASGPLAAGSLADVAGALTCGLYRLGVNWLTAREMAAVAMEEVASLRDWSAELVPIPGIPEALRRLKTGGIKLAVVTADSTHGGEQAIARQGLGEVVDLVIGADRVRASKPFPDLAQAACEALGVKPAEAGVVGDTPADLLMGRRAGVGFCLGVLTGAGRPRDLRPLADAVLPSVADLDVKVARVLSIGACS